MIFLVKNYNYIFEFVKVMSKVLLVRFSPTRCIILRIHIKIGNLAKHYNAASLPVSAEEKQNV